MPEYSQDDLNQVVELVSEMGDLSYLLAPDPNPVGVQQRLRIQAVKHILHADPPPSPVVGPMPTVMYDSVTAADIPSDAKVVAGYVDGDYAWSQADWDRFTQAVSKITITTLGGQVADVCDCETGDLTPDMAAGWIQQYPGNIVYCNRANVPAVMDAMTRAGLGQINGEGFNQYRLWVADWTGQAHMVSIPGADVVATQYASPEYGSGGHFDLSLVTPELLANFLKRPA